MAATANTILYNSLKELQENFYSIGSFSDANAKLEEITKVIFLYIILEKELNPKLLLNNYSNEFLSKMNALLSRANKIYLKESGIDLFGKETHFTIDEEDTIFLKEIFRLVQNVLAIAHQENKNGHSFDLLNEIFGYFIRDSFRSHIEDAQYLTPPEVVNYIKEIVVQHNNERIQKEEFIVMDPACGVGSFLVAIQNAFNNQQLNIRNNLRLIGQDKVDRMVRLTTINMLMTGSENHLIFKGNSLLGDTKIDHFYNKVDVIVTNPPFNAKFSPKKLKEESKMKYPHLFDLFYNTSLNIDSELLFIDRSLSLLKDNGLLIIVVPDSVISSQGHSELLRKRIEQKYHIDSIVDLPSVTFAQAGTRAKTSILTIRKKKDLSNWVFLSTVNSIGYEVSSRKGVRIKKYFGNNELLDVKQQYKEYLNRNSKIQNDHIIFSESPSCIGVPQENIINEGWSPSIHNSTTYRTKYDNDKKYRELNEIASFVTKERKKEIIPEDYKCISVLHVLYNGIIDYSSLIKYEPKYPGIRCHPGDILISKINPHIQRILVVPDYGFPLTCSSEFEILKPKNNLDPYEIVIILTSPIVYEQISKNTSGTSSSHRRIKTDTLKKVLVPDVWDKSTDRALINNVVDKQRKQMQPLNNMLQILEKNRFKIEEVFY